MATTAKSSAIVCGTTPSNATTNKPVQAHAIAKLDFLCQNVLIVLLDTLERIAKLVQEAKIMFVPKTESVLIH